MPQFLGPLFTHGSDGLKPTFQPRYESPTNYELAHKQYGHQMSTRTESINSVLRGRFEAWQPVRRLQLNHLVTSGVNWDGSPLQYGGNGEYMNVIAKKEELGIDSSELYAEFQSLFTHKPMPLLDCLASSCAQAVRMREAQLLQDGNHRTSLACFIMSLAQSNVVVTEQFDFLVAYLIISGRWIKPTKYDGLKSTAEEEEVSLRLRNYARRKVQPATADYPYFLRQMTRIRQAVVDHSALQEQFQQIISTFHDHQERRRLWGLLGEGGQRAIQISYGPRHY